MRVRVTVIGGGVYYYLRGIAGLILRSSNILKDVCRFTASIGISRQLVGGLHGFLGDLISGVGFLYSSGLCAYLHENQMV
jgi:hypothetical protein